MEETCENCSRYGSDECGDCMEIEDTMLVVSRSNFKLDKEKLSDGHHTFGELYALFGALCDCLCIGGDEFVFKSKQHLDGSMFEGCFIAGIVFEDGRQITYHLPLNMWDTFPAEIVEKAPKWDGHTPNDVVERLKDIFFYKSD